MARLFSSPSVVVVDMSGAKDAWARAKSGGISLCGIRVPNRGATKFCFITTR